MDQDGTRETGVLFKDLFLHSKDAVFVFEECGDGPYRIIECNVSFVRLVGRTRSDIIGKTCEETFPVEIGKAVREKYRNTVGSDQVCLDAMDAASAAGGKHYLTTVIPVKGESDGNARFIGITSDISDCKDMIPSLSARAREFYTLFENSSDIIIRYDTECKRTYVNRSFERVLGIPRSRAIGERPTGEWPSASSAKVYLDSLRRVLATGESCDVTFEGTHHQGSVSWFSFRIEPMHDESGRTIGAVAIGRDIGSQKTLENRFAKHIGMIPGFFFVICRSSGGIYTMPYSSPRFGEFEDPSRDEIVANPLLLLSCIDPEDLGPVRRTFIKSARTLAQWRCEFRISLRRNVPIWIEIRAAPQREDDGGIAWYGSALEITERKAIENELRTSEVVLNRAQAMAKTGSFRFKMPENALTWSDETYRIFEIPIGTPVSEQTVIDYCVQEDLPHVVPSLAGVYQNKPFYIEYRIKTLSGIKWVRAKTELFFDKSGVATEGIGTIQDVSDYRNALLMVEQREDFLNTIIDTSAEGFVLFDAGQRILRANGEYCAMSGYRMEELLTMKIRDIEIGLSDKQIDEYAAQCRRRGKIRFETKHRKKNGEEIDVDVYASAIGDDIVAFFRDITERKRSSSRLELLNFAMDHVADAAYLVNNDGKFVYVNAAACANLGYDRAKLMSLKVSDIDPGWNGIEYAEQRSSLEKKQTVTIVSKHRRRNGTLFPVEISANYFIYGGEPFNLCLVRDISDQKKSAKIKQLVELATQITNELADMVAADESFESSPSMSSLGFTARQIEIARHVVAGEPSKAIAQDLGITEATVKAHLALIYRRLRVKGRIEFCNYVTQKDMRLE